LTETYQLCCWIHVWWVLLSWTSWRKQDPNAAHLFN